MKIIIREDVYQEIDYYVQKSHIEISGLGRMIKRKDGAYEVIKVYLLDQENSAASTDLDADAVAKLMFETREDEGMLNFWWHSHVNMIVYMSPTDTATMKQFGDNGFLVGTVFNKKRELFSAYYQGETEILPSLYIDKVETTIEKTVDPEREKDWEANYDAKAKVKARKPLCQGGKKTPAHPYGTEDYYINLMDKTLTVDRQYRLETACAEYDDVTYMELTYKRTWDIFLKHKSCIEAVEKAAVRRTLRRAKK